MNEEIWKDIPGYEGHYMASDRGRIMTIKNGRRRIANRLFTDRGYVISSLSLNGDHKLIKVHRLIAMTFLDNPLGLKEVNHKDLDKTNNHVSNLEWSTRKNNVIHAASNGRMSHVGFKNGNAKIFLHQEYGIYCTQKEAANMMGITEQVMSLIFSGQMKFREKIKFVPV